MKKVAYILFPLLTCTTLSLASALDAVQPAPTSPVSVTKVSVVADVNLVNLIFSEKDNTYSGSFALQAKMGKQNNIAYGVVVMGSKGQVLSFEKLGTVPSLQQGELLTKSFTYRLPPLKESKVDVLLVAENEEGLRLSTRILAKDRSVTAASPTITCAVNKEEVASCTFKESATISIGQYTALFGPTIGMPSSVIVKKGETKTFPLVDKPGRYIFVATNVATKEMVVVPTAIAGSYGQIKNATVVSKGPGKIALIAYVRVSPFKGSKIAYSLKAHDGSLCGEAVRPITDLALEEEFNTSCKEGVVTLSLFGQDGTLLDQKTEDFSTIVLAPKGTQSAMTPARLAVGILIILVLISIAFMMFKKYSAKSVVVSALFLMMVVSGVGRGYAASYFVRVWGPPLSMAEIAFMCNVSVTSDKATYSPGESMIVTGTVSLSRDAGADSGDTGYCYLSYFSSFDVTSGASYNFAQTSGAFLDTITVLENTGQATLSAPVGIGSHYLGTRTIVEAWRGGSRWTTDSQTGNVTFDVVDATPTVNLNFGQLLNKAKSFAGAYSKKLDGSLIPVAHAAGGR